MAPVLKTGIPSVRFSSHQILHQACLEPWKMLELSTNMIVLPRADIVVPLPNRFVF
jgi:hypothetical protein